MCQYNAVHYSVYLVAKRDKNGIGSRETTVDLPGDNINSIFYY